MTKECDDHVTRNGEDEQAAGRDKRENEVGCEMEGREGRDAETRQGGRDVRQGAVRACA